MKTREPDPDVCRVREARGSTCLTCGSWVLYDEGLIVCPKCGRIPVAKSPAPEKHVCTVKSGDPDTALPDRSIALKGGGGVSVIGRPSSCPLDGSDRPRDVARRSWRLVKPTGPERRALQAIRARAGSALAGTSAAMLATDLATTRTHAQRILDRLALKGWIVSDSKRSQWMPTSMAGLAWQMADVERLVVAVAGLSRFPSPLVLASIKHLAKALAVTAGPSRGCVAHPTARSAGAGRSRSEETSRGLRRWQRLRLEARTVPAVQAARQQLAASPSAA